MNFKNLFFLICIIFSGFTFAGNNQATIIKISGEAYIDGAIINEGMIIHSGQVLKMHRPKDYADVKLLNGSIVRLAGGAVKFIAVTEEKSHFRLMRGIFYSLVQKLTKNESFVVKTNYASFGVRGTKFYIQEDKDQSYLCVCEGIVEANKQNKILAVKKDQDLFINDKKPYKVTTASKNMITMGNDIFSELKKY